MEKNENIDDITVVVATSPCQGMSIANHKKKDEQASNSLVIESIKIILDVKPRFFVLENVRAFLKTVRTDVDGVDKSIEEAINNNLGTFYDMSKNILNFKNYGANPSRTRTLIIGTRKDLDIFPDNLLPEYTDEKK